MQGLQTNVFVVEANVPIHMPTEEVVDFIVGDGSEGPTAPRQRPGKKRRIKWMGRLQEAAQRALAHTPSVPAGLSRKSRKRMRMGTKKDLALAHLLQSQETVRTRSTRAPSAEGSHPGDGHLALGGASPSLAVALAPDVGAPQELISRCLHDCANIHGGAIVNGMLKKPASTPHAQIVTAEWRQKSRSDTNLVPHEGAMAVAIPASAGLDSSLKDHLGLAMLVVWVANSPPASSQVRGHSFGTCGLGVHWWNDAKRATGTTEKQENIRLYHAWRFEVSRALWQHWVPILPRVWEEVISCKDLQGIVNTITSDCDAITSGNQIQRLHDRVPFTSGYMADAGGRGTLAHFDQTTVKDSWVMIFSSLDVHASGGEFWVVDPKTDKAVVLHAGNGMSIVLCKAGWFKHGAMPVIGGSRVVTVLWNNPKIRDDRLADPRPMFVEGTSSTWPPGANKC